MLLSGRLIRHAAVAALATAIVACGSSPTGPSTSVTLSSAAAFDGWAQSNGVANASAAGPLVGDADQIFAGVGYREFYSFDLSAIPAGATIDSATLKLYQANVKGQPYTVLGNVIVDHVDLGTALDGSDYGAPAIASNIGTLSTSPTIEYKTLDVTSSVQADRTVGRQRSQYRLRFSNKDSNNDGVSDLAQFTDAEDSCCGVNQPPQLIVVYRK